MVGLRLSQAFSHLWRGNGGFLALRVSLRPSLSGEKPAFADLSLRRKFPFPAQAETRFDDWGAGFFEPAPFEMSRTGLRLFRTEAE